MSPPPTPLYSPSVPHRSTSDLTLRSDRACINLKNNVSNYLPALFFDITLYDGYNLYGCFNGIDLITLYSPNLSKWFRKMQLIIIVSFANLWNVFSLFHVSCCNVYEESVFLVHNRLVLSPHSYSCSSIINCTDTGHYGFVLVAFL